MNKIAKIAATAAIVLTTATPAFAYSRHSSNGLYINNEDVEVTNNVATVANTGLNFTGGHRSHHVRVSTGDATAVTLVENDVNNTSVNSSRHGSKISINNEDADVTNNVLTVANTGANFTSGGRVRTGDASAGTGVSNWVNTTVVGSSN